MTEFFVAIVFFVIAISGMALALHFSKYKQKDSACCGGGHCEVNGQKRSGSCYQDKLDYIDNKVVKNLN